MNLNRLARAAAGTLLILAGVGGGPVAPAAADPPPAYFVDETKLSFDQLPEHASQRYWGVHNGAGYRIEVPANWNGELVMWAHGYRGEGLELTVSNPRLREYFLSNGFAWAASSYSRNGYDVSVGVQDTHALTQLFNGIVGRPQRVYLAGESMGGHITAAAIEQYRDKYDGAMPVCGVLGDYELFDFFLDYNLVAAALAGVPTTFPPDPNQWTNVTVPQIKANLATTWPTVLNVDGEHLKAMTELRSGGIRPLFDVGWNVWASFLFTLGTGDGTLPRSPGVVVDNTDAVYQFDTDPALTPEEQALNAEVVRVAQDPSGRVEYGLANAPVVNGTPSVPVLTMHTLGDLFVPFAMEQVYAGRVAANGLSDLVVQRAIRDVGHCGFTITELERGFADLVNWVEHGVRPAGDDVLDPAVVAQPGFGCTFTVIRRPYAPAC